MMMYSSAMQQKQIIYRFRKIKSTADLSSLINELKLLSCKTPVSQNVTSVEKTSAWKSANGICHFCSTPVSVEEMEFDWFGGTDKCLPIHRTCLNAKSQASPSELAIAFKIGFWVRSQLQNLEPKSKKWLVLLAEKWLCDCGKKVEEFLLPSHEKLFDITQVRSLADLLILIRSLYIFEREIPKMYYPFGLALDPYTGGDWQKYNTYRKKAIYSVYREKFTNLNKQFVLIKSKVQSKSFDPAINLLSGVKKEVFIATKNNAELALLFDKTFDEFNNHKETDSIEKVSNILKNVRSSPNNSITSAVFEKTGGHCAFCNGLLCMEDENLKLEVDYVVPFCKGGRCEEANYQPMHKFCNAAVGTSMGNEVLLSLQIGRWVLQQLHVEDNQDLWKEGFLNSYASYLR
jgi:hypothetical protein